MNIIKFKDQLRPGDALFNTYLKGKYAYWIQMRYVVPFDFISTAQYVQYENDSSILTNWQARGCSEPDPRFWDLQGKHAGYGAWVDVEATESANNIIPFTRSNKYTTDEDLTIDDVKKFRQWLADSILEFDRNEGGEQKISFFDETTTEMLLYYKNNLYNTVVKSLNNIPSELSVTSSNVTKCSCGSGTDVSNLYNNSVLGCDALAIYRQYIYKVMCGKFSDIDFWTDFPVIFIWEFKKYIDNIITLNLTLTQSPYKSVFTDCSCSFNLQSTQLEILNRLSTALEYIGSEEISGNRNFISKALSDWAQNLYENMYWA
jgi:hypothetical protein